jgi:hypothetical protein
MLLKEPDLAVTSRTFSYAGIEFQETLELVKTGD